MTKLSVNVNKIALLRNSRNDNSPNLLHFVSKIIDFGCDGITLHPRSDERHITINDIKEIRELPDVVSNGILINVESDLRQEIIELILDQNVHQFTIVPVDFVTQKTTERGWKVGENEQLLKETVALLANKVRLILFAEPEEDIVRYAHNIGFHGVEFHTKCYANSFDDQDSRELEIERIKKVADLARKLNLYVHLGHNLSLENLYDIVTIIKPDEISVGHNLITEALLCGLDSTIGSYRKICDV